MTALAALDEPLYDDAEQLAECIAAVKEGKDVHALYRAYVVISYWYAQSKADVRELGKRSGDEYQMLKRREDILEGLVLSAKEGIQLVKHLNRKEMADY